MINFIMDSFMEARPSFWTLAVSCLSAAILLVLLFSRNDPTRRMYPTLNERRPFELSDARLKKNFIINGRRLLREGLEKFQGGPFRILTDHGPTLIFPPSYTQELRNLDNLSHVLAIAQVQRNPMPHSARMTD